MTRRTTRPVGRRELLRAGAGAALALGLTATVAGPAAAAGRRGAEALPPVPGMLGDRRANEFWYQMDEVALYHPTQATLDAYKAVIAYAGSLEKGIKDTWLAMSKLPEYPGNYRTWARPMEQPLRVISRMQLDVVDSLYFRRDPRLTLAWSAFGQGILYDPRRASVGAPVHTMDGPQGYHTWHAYLRAMMLLGIDRERWAEIAPLQGFAWALQSIARPASQTVNPPLPRKVVFEQASYWLRRSAMELDSDFQSVPFPKGIG
ncbi:hypothetical protein ACFV29_43335 [Streptomyces sp. NPDC059690]|uniref:hypothetical protein n=1 Tax=Streptomyces sp. NPDC059690 TaxID=3346907 RepID=UPI003692086B